jgi:N,N-dimethylformamidase beta subunit-like, C-terminal
MPTPTHISAGGLRRTILVLSAVPVAFALGLLTFGGTPGLEPFSDDDVPGSALPVTGKPTAGAIEATFSRRSYRPGETAELRIATPASKLIVRVYRAGHGHDGVLQGAPVASPTLLARTPRIRIRVGDWPSGLYYVRLSAPKSHFGYAPFVVRSRGLGGHRVAVVLPTNTWQAYNFYDADGDGRPDSWYGNPHISCVQLDRPYLDRGVPPHYAGYDRGFVRWLAKEHEDVDVLTDDDLERVGGIALAQAYDLIVFSGHEEYVTEHEFDVTERYRDLGGNLMFLSANNFFYRVERHGNHICRTGRWRDLGRPEATLVGIQYVDWYQQRYPNRPYVAAGVAQTPWAFRGTGLHNGDRFGNYGIEIDGRTSDSPPGLTVLARIRDAFGPGKSAEMTYYTTSAGSKVFAAGVINFGGTALWPVVSTLLDNLWKELTNP